MTGDEHFVEANRLLCGDELDMRAALVHATLAVAAYLAPRIDNNPGTCVHGFTGLCMYCVRDMDLLRPR